MENNLIKDMDFIVEIDKIKNIFRQTTLMDGSRRENDAEHSWHLATMAMVLEDYSDEEVDINKVIKMLLIHDLVEIYAGDTFCYDLEGNKDKAEREKIAAEKIYGILPDDKGEYLKRLWEEFEERETAEAKFAAAMDRVQPILCNYYSGGGTWVKYGITRAQVMKRAEPIKDISQDLWEYILNIIDDSIEKGYIENK